MLSKKKIILLITLVLAIFMTGCGEDITGSGTEEDPFVVYTLEGLEMIGNEEGYTLDAYYKLGADIDANATGDDTYNDGKGWESIGNDDYRFTGIIDGNGYKIEGLYINRPSESYQGLFDYNEGLIKNIGLTDVNFKGNNDVGGLVARNFGELEGVYVKGELAGSNRVGGLVARNVGEIKGSYSKVEVEGNDNIGELAGIDYGTIYKSSPTGKASVTGSGKEENPYVLYSFTDLEMLSLGYLPLDAYYILDNDIDASITQDEDYNDGQGWRGMGGFSFDDDYEKVKNGFKGDFDGQGNEISNLYINRMDNDIDEGEVIGFFAAINEGRVKNLGLVDANFKGGSGIGGLVGINFEGRIENSYLKGNLEADEAVGGLVLVSFGEGEIIDSYTRANIEGSRDLAGLVGYNEAKIIGSYSTGEIIGEEYVAGLVAENSGLISSSYTTGNIMGDNNLGGLVVRNNFDGEIKESYTTSNLTGDNDLGRLVVRDTGYIYKSSPRGEMSITGSGSEDDPYVFHSFIDLEMLSLGYLPLDANYELSDDIDASITQDEDYNDGQGWRAIGMDYEVGNDYLEGGFKGSFDGGGNKISNLYIKDYNSNVDERAIGLFSAINQGEIKNIDLVDVEVKGDEAVSGLLGVNFEGKVINSSVKGEIEGNDFVAGLVGFNVGFDTDAEIIASYSKANVRGRDDVAGLVASSNGRILDSYAEGHIQGEFAAGGLVSYNQGAIARSYSKSNIEAKEAAAGLVVYSTGEIEDSYAKGSVKADEGSAGLVAINEGLVDRSYSSSSVEGSEELAGLVVINFDSIENSYWDVESSGLDSSDGGIAKTTTEMQKEATYDAFDFDEIWQIDEDNSYPYLKWE